MDRSTEFFSLIDSLHNRAQPHISSDKRRLLSPIEQHLPSNGTNASKGPKSDFALMASLINKDISATSTKLQKLARLAKRKTLFDDRPVEISELIFIIKQDIAKLNKQIAQLQLYLKDQSSKSTNGTGKQAVEHNTNIVVMLQSRLAAQTSRFKEVLELRTENMKATKDRREQFMFTAQQQSNTFTSNED
ncbi:cis-Golgi t-SNARE syntaxin [Haplosporangium sp. Z 27]|nr:cis-Golgi t-SNARE syntaxin [Haplosporangium sp. Z 27]